VFVNNCGAIATLLTAWKYVRNEAYVTVIRISAYDVTAVP